MKFDWKGFCQKYNIEYVEDGPNTRRGEISITCPNCGDPSHHLGLNLEKGWFACWRCNTKGKRPEILIQKLLKCSRDEAKRIVGKPVRDTVDFSKQVKDLFGDNEQADVDTSVTELEFPSQFKPIANSTSSFAKPFKDFLVSRGFNSEDIDDLADYYDLRYCLTGFWKNRIIIPVSVNYNLIGWLSRTIEYNNSRRYILLPARSSIDGHRAKDEMTNYCFPYDSIKESKGSILFVVEGAFDALKIDFYGNPQARSTCVFGSNPSDHTIEYITKLYEKGRFDKVVVLMDNMYLSMKVANNLAHLNAEASVVTQADDPGDLKPQQVQELVKQF